jgi:hypothetical protein
MKVAKKACMVLIWATNLFGDDEDLQQQSTKQLK